MNIDSSLNCWEKWWTELPLLKHIPIPHCMKPIDFKEVKSGQVQMFSNLYTALSWQESMLHTDLKSGNHTWNWHHHCYTLCSPWQDSQEHTWQKKLHFMQYHTDSITVLQFISNNQEQFQVCVVGLVQMILNPSHSSKWRYMDTST